MACPTRADQVRVVLGGPPGPDDVAILMAQQKGFFKDAGLRVVVRRTGSPESAIPTLAAGKGDLAVAPQPQAILERDRGTPLIGVGSLLSRPTGAMIWLRDSGIKRLADLAGKAIAVPGPPFQKLLLKSALAEVGLTLEDVKIEEVGRDAVPALMSGKVDAIFGGSPNIEGAALQARGARPVITKLPSLGIPSYEEPVVVAPYRCVYKHPGLIDDFMAAVAHGAKAAQGDPEAAVRAIEQDPESRSAVGKREVKAEMKATLPLLSRTELMDLGIGQPLIEWMTEHEMLKGKWDFELVFTNYYLRASPIYFRAASS